MYPSFRMPRSGDPESSFRRARNKPRDLVSDNRFQLALVESRIPGSIPACPGLDPRVAPE
jgi:hypothetical protein